MADLRDRIAFALWASDCAEHDMPPPPEGASVDSCEGEAL